MFGDPDQRDQMLRRVRTIHNKAKENFEERGLETLSVGCGLASWENKRAAWEPCAPVLLQRASLRPLGAAQDEFELFVTDEIEVNPTLLHVLKVDFGCELDHAALTARIPDGAIDEPWELPVPSAAIPLWRRAPAAHTRRALSRNNGEPFSGRSN